MFFVTVSISIPDHELHFEFVRSSGPGGQNVNKVNSKAVLRWNALWNQSLPTGVRERFLSRFASRLTKDGEVIITSDLTRDQRKNQADCLEKLREMLLLVAHPPKPRKKTKPTRGSQIRRQDSKRKRGNIKRDRQRPDHDE